MATINGLGMGRGSGRGRGYTYHLHDQMATHTTLLGSLLETGVLQTETKENYYTYYNQQT